MSVLLQCLKVRWIWRDGLSGNNVAFTVKREVWSVEQLHGCVVKACDLRAGAAMVIAGLAADGTTTVEDVHYIERGYECMIEKLRAIGADISRVESPDPKTARDAG